MRDHEEVTGKKTLRVEILFEITIHLVENIYVGLVQAQRESKEIEETLEQQDLMVHQGQLVIRGLQARLTMDMEVLDPEDKR